MLICYSFKRKQFLSFGIPFSLLSFLHPFVTYLEDRSQKCNLLVSSISPQKDEADHISEILKVSNLCWFVYSPRTDRIIIYQ